MSSHCLLEENTPIGKSKIFGSARAVLGVNSYQKPGRRAAGWVWAGQVTSDVVGAHKERPRSQSSGTETEYRYRIVATRRGGDARRSPFDGICFGVGSLAHLLKNRFYLGEVGAAIPERNGQPIFKPSATGTYVVATCLALAAALIAMRAGLLPSAALGLVPHLATWALATIFAVRAIGDFRYVGFFKRVRDTRFARLDTAFYSPLCCLLALLIADAACI
jgi:hypothetical protein